MKNYSKQREAIITVLRDMKTHPTASAVHERVREIIPNISLGTVYRNLAALRETGEVLAISIGDGFDHFDGDNRPHVHLHCRECKEIVDVDEAIDAFFNRAYGECGPAVRAIMEGTEDIQIKMFC